MKRIGYETKLYVSVTQANNEIELYIFTVLNYLPLEVCYVVNNVMFIPLQGMFILSFHL